jgi:dihydroorotate dehydrogenase (fumarate)
LSDKVLEGVEGTGKPYLVSLSGLKSENNIEMLKQIATAKLKGAPIAGIELNLACPNIPGKPTVAYDFKQMEMILKQVTSLKELKESKLVLGVKLAPYFDMTYYERACALINNHKDCIKFVTSINTIGNALVVDSKTEMNLIAPNSGHGGLGGSVVKYVALANVRQLRRRLDPSIDIVGVGGVATGEDVFNMILCGASAVQTATTHWLEGPSCFERIAGYG